MQKFPNIWLFGTGYWANILINKIIDIFPENKIYVIDINEDLKSKFLHKYPEFFDSNLETFLDQSQAGDICFVLTSPTSHFELVKLALERFCHCWVEKPLTLNSAEAKFLVKIASNNKSTLFVDNTFLFDPLISRIKLKLTQPSNVEHIYSRRQSWGKILKDYGILWDLLPHDLSIINNTFGLIRNFEILSITYGPISQNLDRTMVMGSFIFNTELGYKVQVELSCISKAKVRQIQLLAANSLTTYDLTPDGSILVTESWSSIPGNQNEVLTPASKIVNNEDSLINALNYFKKLLRNGKFHPSLDFTCGEIELIEQIQIEALRSKNEN